MVKPQIPAVGEIWWLDLHPSASKEQRGRHAALVLSSWTFNRATGMAFFAPITTIGNASRTNNFAVTLTGAGTATTGIVQIDQVKLLDWRTRNAERSKDTVPHSLLVEALERFAPIFGLGLPETND